MVLFQKTVFWQNCKKGHFLAIFYHLSSVDVVQITSNFSRCYLLARFAWYIAQFWQLWQILKRVIFLRFFSIFISNLPPKDDVIEKKPMAEPLLQFPVDFKNLIGSALALWTKCSKRHLFGGYSKRILFGKRTGMNDPRLQKHYF